MTFRRHRGIRVGGWVSHPHAYGGAQAHGEDKNRGSTQELRLEARCSTVRHFEQSSAKDVVAGRASMDIEPKEEQECRTTPCPRREERSGAPSCCSFRSHRPLSPSLH